GMGDLVRCALSDLTLSAEKKHAVLVNLSLPATERRAVLDPLRAREHLDLVGIGKDCLRRLKDKDPDIQQGAREVLNYCTLLHPTDGDADEGATLMRASGGLEPNQSYGELLRVNQSDEQALSQERAKPPLWHRIQRRLGLR